MSESEKAENMAAILEWVRVQRPDMLSDIQTLIAAADDPSNKRAAFVTFLLGAGFEAGRFFQYVNPECPFGAIMPGGDWKSITDEVKISRGE